MQHIFPWSCVFPPWRSAQQMLRWCVAGTLLYIAVGVTVPVVALGVDLVSQRDDGTSSLHDCMRVGKYMIMVASMVAINALFELAHVFLHDLQELNPVAKFASVKLVIFFTFWQGIVLSGLVGVGTFTPFIDPSHRWTSQEQISQAVQHSLICLEMFGASIVHHCAFPVGDYEIVEKKYARHQASMRAQAEQADSASGSRRPRVPLVGVVDVLCTARFGFATPKSEASEALDCIGEDGASMFGQPAPPVDTAAQPAPPIASATGGGGGSSRAAKGKVGHE